MLFNSIDFAFFLPIVFILYWFVFNKSLKFQNYLLLVASYFFYACWDWRFLFLLMFSTFLDYLTGLRISNTQHKSHKKFWFWLSVIVNLGFLGVFKYYNFFVTSFYEGLGKLGIQSDPKVLNIILPVGISFYTFHGLSYVIDIYKDKIKAEKNFIDYALFVSFFPLLVAGPIERATHLLPQIKKQRYFNYENGISGLKQILWGLFKKIVIADSCAMYANTIFNNSAEYSGSTLVLGALMFTFQIYGDFSGYSDIALGTARLFGIDLLKNFSYPYFSRNIAEFWRRWHISLSSWFRDYLYIPLGGSKGGMFSKVRNVLIIFLISGFWHGANWTFILWGLLNAIYIMPSMFMGTNRVNLDIVAKGKIFPSVKEILQMFLTFMLTVFAWIFFRANSVTHAFDFIRNIFKETLFAKPDFEAIDFKWSLFIFLLLFFVIEWFGREHNFALESLGAKKFRPVRIVLYYAIIAVIMSTKTIEQQFIYFQF